MCSQKKIYVIAFQPESKRLTVFMSLSQVGKDAVLKESFSFLIDIEFEAFSCFSE